VLSPTLRNPKPPRTEARYAWPKKVGLPSVRLRHTRRWIMPIDGTHWPKGHV
jgi:hypothetical protein